MLSRPERGHGKTKNSIGKTRRSAGRPPWAMWRCGWHSGDATVVSVAAPDTGGGSALNGLLGGTLNGLLVCGCRDGAELRAVTPFDTAGREFDVVRSELGLFVHDEAQLGPAPRAVDDDHLLADGQRPKGVGGLVVLMAAALLDRLS